MRIERGSPAVNFGDETNGELVDTGYWLGLAAVAILAINLRITAAWLLKQPLVSDYLGYFTISKGLAEHGVFADPAGLHAFMSAGYPLLLTPFFMLFGASVPVALAVNMLLALVTLGLVATLGRAISGRRDVGLLAALMFAIWLPGIWNSTLVAKENLSEPLLVALVLCAIHLARGQHPAAFGLLGGVIWGAGLLTGGSSLLLCAGIATALLVLWRTSRRFAPPLRAALCFALGSAVILAPWLYATNQMLGRPVLTTNASFNLYIGNNPAATGWFVSIGETPLGADWEASRKRLGELGNSDRLQREAMTWISSHPAKAAELAGRKLVYFWRPSMPDPTDFASSRTVATIRLFEVAQYIAIVALGISVLFARGLDRRDRWVLGGAIAGFWLIHGLIYVIPRYRDPIIPVLIVLGSLQLAAWARRRSIPELTNAC